MDEERTEIESTDDIREGVEGPDVVSVGQVETPSDIREDLEARAERLKKRRERLAQIGEKFKNFFINYTQTICNTMAEAVSYIPGGGLLVDPLRKIGEVLNPDALREAFNKREASGIFSSLAEKFESTFAGKLFGSIANVARSIENAVNGRRVDRNEMEAQQQENRQESGLMQNIREITEGVARFASTPIRAGLGAALDEFDRRLPENSIIKDAASTLKDAASDLANLTGQTQERTRGKS